VYTVTVKAHAAGSVESAASASDTATPTAQPAPTVPNAPTGVDAVAGVESIVVTWAAGAANGVTVTGFQASAAPAGGGSPTTCPVTAAGATTCTITGLTAGTVYTVTVKAHAAGSVESAASASDTATPTAAPAETQPNAPTTVTATGGEGTIEVHWVAGDAVDGVTVASYTATATPDASGDPVTCSATGAATLTCTIESVPAGDYTVTVMATSNDDVASDASDASDTVTVTEVGTTPTVPGVPTDVTAAATGSRATSVSWAAPADGGTVASYHVASNNGGGSCDVTPEEGATDFDCAFTLLRNGETYTYSVTAVGEGDTGSSDAATATVVLWPVAPVALPASRAALGSSAGTRIIGGRKTVVSGYGYKPNAAIRVFLYPSRILLLQGKVNGSGTFAATVTIPASYGAKTLVALGLATNNTMRAMNRPITIVRAASIGGAALPGIPQVAPVFPPSSGANPSLSSGGAALPTTGQALGRVLLTGLGLLMAGLVAIGATFGAVAWRRRKLGDMTLDS
jgi:hypothetical protein